MGSSLSENLSLLGAGSPISLLACLCWRKEEEEEETSRTGVLPAHTTLLLSTCLPASYLSEQTGGTAMACVACASKTPKE